MPWSIFTGGPRYSDFLGGFSLSWDLSYLSTRPPLCVALRALRTCFLPCSPLFRLVLSPESSSLLSGLVAASLRGDFRISLCSALLTHESLFLDPFFKADRSVVALILSVFYSVVSGGVPRVLLCPIFLLQPPFSLRRPCPRAIPLSLRTGHV